MDALYEPYQKEVDKVMRVKGYTQGKDWRTLKFAGAEHSDSMARAGAHPPRVPLGRAVRADQRVFVRARSNRGGGKRSGCVANFGRGRAK